MKMLTGLLPASDGEALLFGQPFDASDMASRMRVGYMSQCFSLYTRAHRPAEPRSPRAPVPSALRDRAARAIEQLDRQFRPRDYRRPAGAAVCRSASASACRWPSRSCTSRTSLILDEPTSGVDPMARDRFWELLIDLSRNRGRHDLRLHSFHE